ncbi:hypothetical protein SRB5_60020 [Streptomyces sp. RB5]|uniref:Uncharacterized protein n=1 Tax=Streptomyces smaragdinus TaxID=2585196 RepID=A0A7K0CQX8_9ACTN|nr:hypothetical protein [Streptomyces smaragdinus]MQY15811.1 hypothetical protein [Streptomyces smaragdinus]
MFKRVIAAAGGIALALAGALGGAVATAPAASASPMSCFFRVLESNPEADLDLVEAACLVGSVGGPEAVHLCYSELRGLYVPAVVAMEACRAAAD